MKNIFCDILKGKTVVVGVGNTLRGDDGAGPALIASIRGRVKAVCLDAGSAPENTTGQVIRAKPDTILIVDALHLGEEPGAYAILPKEEIGRGGLSTHDLSPKMLIEYLEKETGADVFLLGIQPENLTFGSGLSPEVKESLAEIAELIEKAESDV